MQVLRENQIGLWIEQQEDSLIQEWGAFRLYGVYWSL